MSIASANKRQAGFTLLEIMLAVTILAMMSLAIYRFVQTNLVVLRTSAEIAQTDAAYDGLRDVLTAEWQSLPSGVGALAGDAVKVNDLSRDEITWTCGPGPGLFTRYAGDDYKVSMQLRAEKNNPGRLDLGVNRRAADDEAATDVHETWIPLLQNVIGLEIRYFDPRLNVWQERWTDNVALPRLVRVTVTRKDTTVPWQAIIALSRTSL